MGKHKNNYKSKNGRYYVLKGSNAVMSAYNWDQANESVKPEAALLPSGKTAAGRGSMCPVTIRKPESLVVIPFTAKHRKKSQRNCVLQPPVLTTAPFRNRVKSR